MRIIFSRKAVDRSSGGFPSPIFPDGTSFPIPNY
ncbi:Nmad3 family putative nucleotide modification protein [Desulfurobacterium sp.]